MACDFCGSLKPTWNSAAKPFLFELGPGTILRSRGNWRACDECKPHLDAGNFEPVIDRLEAGRKEVGQEVSASARANVTNYLEEFALHRQGEAVKHEPKAPAERPFEVAGNKLIN
jgi:hypothetical protein